MIIEFADPGYNWTAIVIGVVIVLASIGLMIALYPVLDNAVAPITIFPMMAIVFAPIVGSIDYSRQVDSKIETRLIQSGFSNIDLSGDRFTAATEDGQFFSGILVDLEPDSGYAYQVLEITPTK